VRNSLAHAKTIKQTGLNAILKKLTDDGLRPGEFTSKQVFVQHRAAGGDKSYHAVRFMISTLAENGDLLARKTVIDGRVTNAYRVP